MAKKRDEGHEETEKVLADIEKEISKEYAQAEKEISEKLDDYLRRFEVKDKIKYNAWQEGKITEAEYKQWRLGQVAVGERWQEMKDSLAQDFTNAAEIGKSITDGHMPEVYAINHNYGTYQVEQTAHVDTSYTLYDRQSVEHLFKGEGKLYHDYGIKTGMAIAEGKQMAWDRKQIQSVMTQALLQGESIGKIATRLSKTVGDSDRKACIRNARTMTTGVQNAGRVDSYKRAESMGIELEQEWLATLDSRTRHEHRMLDGQRVKVGEKFKVDGYELAFPADPEGEAFLVYNCRCTLVPALKGFEVDSSDTSLRHTDYMNEQTYDEWKESHYIISDPITKQDDIAEVMKEGYRQEYVYLAGQNPYTPNDPNYTPPTEQTRGKEEDTKENQPVVVTTREEAYNSINTMFGSGIDTLGKMDETLLIENVNKLNELNARFKVLSDNNTGYITTSPSGRAVGYTSGGFRRDNSFNLGLVGKYYKSPKMLEKDFFESRDSNFNMPATDEYKHTYVIIHEYGHMLEAKISRGRTDFDALKEKVNSMYRPSASQLNGVYEKAEEKCAKDIFNEIVDIAKENNPDFKLRDNISDYGKTNYYEFFAEAFANSQCGDPNELGNAMIKWLEKEGY